MKSDDITGRVKTYEAIVRGENVPEPGIPESFRVLVKELEKEEDKEDTLKVEEIDAETSIRDGEIELKGDVDEMPNEDYEDSEDEELEDDELEDSYDELDEEIEDNGEEV